MPVYDGVIRANIGFLVDTVKARGGTASRGTRRGAVIRCMTLLFFIDFTLLYSFVLTLFIFKAPNYMFGPLPKG